MPLSRHLLLLLGAVLCRPAFAQSPDATIVVSASRTGEGVAAASSTITAADIARLQSTTLIDALNNVAGVRAISTGGAAGGSYVSIRGGEPNFTLVLIDGVRVNDPTNSKGGGFDFSLIDPALVQSIEVGRGAISAVHGSDALSGVINVRLQDPPRDQTHATARIQSGTDGATGGGATLSHGWRDGGVLLGGSLFDSHDQTEGSRLKRAQALARLVQHVGDYDLTALGMIAHNKRDVFPEDSGGPQRAVLRNREHGDGDLWTTALSLRHADSGAIRPHASVSYSRQTSDTATPAIAPGKLSGVPAIVADNRLSRFEAITDAVAVVGPISATLGAAYLDEQGRSRGTVNFGFPVPAGFRLDRRTLSGFAEATVQPLDWITLNAAVRHDRVEHGPREWTGRADLSLRPVADGPTLFVRASEGFKLPSFYALASPLIGNPALRPERSRAIEAGGAWSLGSTVDLRVAWYRNRFRDLVDFDPVIFKSVNRSRVATRGIEVEGSVRPMQGVTLAAALTHVAIDSPTPLRARPSWQGNLRAAWAVSPRLSLGGAFRFNDRFYDSSVPTGLIRQPGHSEVDANLGYRLSRVLRIDVALRNLFNAGYQEAVGFPAPGRALRATLSAAL